MSTRAVVTFKDEMNTFSIYAHDSENPKNVLDMIRKSFEFAWDMPRFEAMDFAAAFVRANKTAGGGIYITTDAEAHGDLFYDYLVTPNEKAQNLLIVKIYEYQYDAKNKLQREYLNSQFVSASFVAEVGV